MQRTRIRKSSLSSMRSFGLMLLLMWMLLELVSIPSFAVTDPSNVNALSNLQKAWSSTFFSWSGDPCNDRWTGITCDASNTNVIKLVLPAMEIDGTLAPQISNLNNLQVLDLSFNGNLTGNLPTELFLLTNLSQLFLQFCGFMGSIPPALGSLKGLTYLALNHNNFTGPIPDTIGQLSQLFWFDISSNQLTGNLPPALSNLTNTKHFHLQDNNFTGIIPTGTFNSHMTVVHLLLNNNSFQGLIPTDIGSLPKLDILQLDFNSFTSIPHSLTELTTLSTMKVDHNNINGSIPDLAPLANLQILDLGHNHFTTSPIPSWVSSLPHLQYLGMESVSLEGGVPTNVFSPSNLTTVLLGYNSLNGTLDLQDAGPNLAVVDLEQNNIDSLKIGSFTGVLNLQRNLICGDEHGASDAACHPTTTQSSIQPSACGCSQGLGSNPTAPSGSCLCSYPVSGVLVFIALKVTLDSRVMPTLQAGFMKNIPIVTRQDQVSISIVSGVVANISIFPNNAEVWEVSDANLITALLSSKAILFPTIGPYEYLPFGPYKPPEVAARRGMVSGVFKIALSIGAAALAIIMLCIGGYAFMQKKRADKAEEVSKPFASWIVSGDDNGGAPRVKGSRLFSLSEIKRATNNFSKSNEIGAGGYGKVYKGILLSGQQVAIKRAQASSLQGGAEFKTEIELLSRVHHRNLVGLVGFCFEEQMLVYELMPNGTLRDSLSGRTNVKMDWRTRLNVALGSACGLAYLHTEADPPIIHRDIKSSNILLDEKLVAKVADFGLSKLAPDDDGTGKGHVSTQVKGTLGYLDPEYYTSQRLTERSDVYSFGVVMLELITSKQPIENGKYIVREVRNAIQKGGIPGMLHLQDTHLIDCPIEDLKVFLDVALCCVEEVAALRPTMRQVAKELETLLTYSNTAPVPARPVLTPVVANGHKQHEQELDYCFQEKLDYPTDVDSRFQYSGGIVVPVLVEPK